MAYLGVISRIQDKFKAQDVSISEILKINLIRLLFNSYFL
jgi:hypothetical protein